MSSPVSGSSSASSRPKSLVISTPASGVPIERSRGAEGSSSGRASMGTDGPSTVRSPPHRRVLLSLPSQFPASSLQEFQWPPSASPSSSSAEFGNSSTHARHPSDPFDTLSFAEDPFSHRSSSGSSEDGGARMVNAASLGERRPSGVLPLQFRSASDSVVAEGQPVDIEFTTGAPPDAPPDGYNFDTAGQPQPPQFNRTFSAPLPARMGALRHPLSPTRDRLDSYSAHPPRLHTSFSVFSTPNTARPWSTKVESDSSLTVVSRESSMPQTPQTPLQAISIELADSLQSAIQTLLHLSPPHMLDNAKEQYSGCTVQMPTTSLSALFTSMRTLNYLSANVENLCEGMTKEDLILTNTDSFEDFDIGELLQSVADSLGGQAAQAGVDLALFHGDVGIKHISVHGDGEGLGYLLSHIVRQILLIADKGDAIELGLQVLPQSPAMTPRSNLPLSAEDVEDRRAARSSSPGRTTLPSRPSDLRDGPMLCVFEVVHNKMSRAGSAAATPKAEGNPFARLAEEREASKPRLSTMMCRRLLRQQNASLKQEAEPSSPADTTAIRLAYELSIMLPRGKPLVEPPILSAEEEAIRQPFVSVRLAREPTLAELSHFAESLRGKKAFLHASLSSVFGRHLTSYLAAWGVDVSHIPFEDRDDSSIGRSPAKLSRHDSGYGGSANTTPAADLLAGSSSMSPSPSTSSSGTRDIDKFIIIDDDVSVLRRELLRLRLEAAPLALRPRTLMKRPTLIGRARSTPHVRQVSSGLGKSAGPVLIHFTSLTNYNQVRDIVSNYLGSPNSVGLGAFAQSEVMVIPKPIGPRRFLTALHTAVNQPLVDPFFSPIATTPRSPGGGYFAGIRTPQGSEITHGFFDAVAEETETEGRSGSDGGGSQKARSPLGEFPPAAASIVRTEAGLHLSLPTPGDITALPAAEYFANTGSKTVSGASGVVMQSPDGRPFGMFFEPPVKNERKTSYTERRTSYTQRPAPEAAKRKNGSRRTSGAAAEEAGAPTISPQTSRRVSAASTTSGRADETETSSRPPHRPNTAGGSKTDATTSLSRSFRRKTLPTPTTDPIIATGRDRAITVNARTAQGVITSPKTDRLQDAGSPSNGSRVGQKAALSKSNDGPHTTTPQPIANKKSDSLDMVVPPINVLIVEDNPININILSMFLRKKKIKYQTAKDGLEAVEKWKTGGFHLILMDIQLPVMNGIEATKEIRQHERSNNIGVFPSTPISEHPRPLNPEATLNPFRSSVIIVALTASSLQSDRVAALAAGCNDFLTKPVSLKWLEKKIVEWGCMQALIDFDGWRRWKTSDPRDGSEVKQGFQAGPQQAARNLAGRLRIERRTTRPVNSRVTDLNTPAPAANAQDVTPQAVPSAVGPLDNAAHPADSLGVARSEVSDNKLSAVQPAPDPLPAADSASALSSLGSINEVVEGSPVSMSGLLLPPVNPT